ncbi:MAG: methylenetetrahydrofolate reductase C-terminal domain-containing protein [bacterium]
MLKNALLNGEFVITCEFVPGRGQEGASLDAALLFSKDVAGSLPKIHAVSLTDNPGGNTAMIPDALAPEILKTGMDVLIHFSCRDMNRNAMESRLMALARAGANNLLVISGDYPSGGFEGNAASVFDLDSVQAVKYIKSLNAGLEVPGAKKGTTTKLAPTHFLVAAAVSPFKATEAELLPQFFKLEKKIAAGADFIIPQLGYDMRKFLEIKRYLRSRDLNVPVIGNVYVLSLGAAKTMNAGLVPGCVVTDELLRVVEAESKDPDKGKAKRLERAAKMVAMFKGMGFNGVHIGGFALKTDDFKFIITRATELEARWEEFIPEVSFSRPGEYYAFPPPVNYASLEKDEDIVRRIEKGHRIWSYEFSKLFHRIVFDRSSVIARLLTRYYKMIGDKSALARLSHAGEHATKMLMYKCQDCGDCALADMAFCCPKGRCAKQQRNGPCGGSVKGMCEAYPDERPCAWTLVYNRKKSDGNLDEMRTSYIPPQKSQLAHTSGWANYFLNRDHSAHPKT